MCKTSCLVLLFGLAIGSATCGRQLRGDDWPQWRGPTRDGVWKETGLVEKFSAPRLPLRWRAPIGSGYSGPTVAEGRVYVTDLQTDPSSVERVHCFDWQTGRNLWNFTYDCTYKNVGYMAGPRASVSIDDGRAYALGTMGHLHCLDAATGKLLWKKDPGRGLQDPHADLGHCLRAAGRWRAGDRPARRRRGVPAWPSTRRPAPSGGGPSTIRPSYSAPIIIRAGRPASARLLDGR